MYKGDTMLNPTGENVIAWRNRLEDSLNRCVDNIRAIGKPINHDERLDLARWKIKRRAIKRELTYQAKLESWYEHLGYLPPFGSVPSF
jgi:hypothetical protein